MSFPLLQDIQSWADFKSRVGSLPKKGKGDAFEAFVLAYLNLAPQYTTLLQNVWLLRDVPVDVRTHLNLPDRDEGIDLVARTREGTYWAIQCKYVEDEDHSLSRKALSTFTDLAFTVCRNIDYALVCTTADRFSHKLTLYGERLGFLAGDAWRNLDDEFFASMGKMLQGQKVVLVPREPRPHQQRAIENAETHFLVEGNSRGKLILPCGTGKSLTGYWIAEALQAKTILVAVPSLALVRQTLKEWLRESVANGHDVQWIAVCSDESVADQKRDDVAVLTQDLGIRVHTDPQEISGWLRTHHDGLTVVFTTYQSGRATAEAVRLSGTTFDLAILDEAHKTVGRKSSLFSHLLFDENLHVRHRVFMTATERRYLGNSDQIASMTDPDIYGDTFELLTFKESLETDPPILSDYRIVTIVVTRAEIRELVQENLFVRPDRGRWDDDVEAEMLAAAIALRKAIQKHPIRHAVSFHSSISRATAFKSIQDALTKAFSNFGHLETFHVSGNTPTAKRSKELERFVASSPSLVTNARCLTEGVDVPGIDCVLFADPKRSTVDIVQAVGRALRLADGKEYGYVIVPVLIDEELGDDPDAQYEAFAPVLTVLRSLAGNDERIVEYFRSVSEGRKRSGREGGELIDIPDGVFVDVKAFVEAIELEFWSRLAKLSWRPFVEAREFVRSLGLNSRNDWDLFCQGKFPEKGVLPEDIPRYPNGTYKNTGWKGMGDWLGTGTISPSLRTYMPFDEARAYARNLKLNSISEWRSFCTGELAEKGSLPNDIPRAPHLTFHGKGWEGWGDWLGTGAIAPSQRVFRPFIEAREFARSIGLKTQMEWSAFCRGKLPEKGFLLKDIPSHPDRTYKNEGWKNFGDWLGTGNIAPRQRIYHKFIDARTFARGLGLNSYKEWKSFCQGKLNGKGTLPKDIPASPHQVYINDGWQGWGDFLGTGNINPFEKNKRYQSRQRVYQPFLEAREFAHTLFLSGENEWRKFCKGEMPEKGFLPVDIPYYPNKCYAKNEWISWGDWLGTGTVASSKIEFCSFEEARKFARLLNFKGQTGWFAYCRGEHPEKGIKPQNIPSRPQKAYAGKGWTNWGDFLGTGRIADQFREYVPYEQARDFARGFNFSNQVEWFAFCRGEMPEKGTKPDNIPVGVAKTYKGKGWLGWGDFLGTRNVAPTNRKYRSFVETRTFARSLNLRSKAEWGEYCRGNLPEKGVPPFDIPTNPNRTYSDDGWDGWGNWLGTGTVAPSNIRYRSFAEARSFARSLELKSKAEWQAFCQGKKLEKGSLPKDIPATPERTYAGKGWISTGDWLGTRSRRVAQSRNFEDARKYAQSVGLKTEKEWKMFCKGMLPGIGLPPEDIPTSPNYVYKNKGWKSWPDWFGK